MAMQEHNNAGHEVHAPKLSKLAVLTFCITAIVFVCDFTIGFEYTDSVQKLIGIGLDALCVYFFYWVWKRTQKRGLRGVQAAKIAFIGIVILSVIDWASAIPLSRASKSLNEFAIQTSPSFFGDDLTSLKSYGDANIVRMMSYQEEAAKFREDLIGVGKVSECTFDLDGTYSKVKFGPETRINKVSYMVTGEYLVRCYGENKPIDITVGVTRENDTWKISAFQYNNDLFGKEEQKEEDGKNTTK